MSRRKSAAQPEGGPSFEESLSAIEAIVGVMEQGALPLEELVARYEQGTALLNRCEAILNTARERIELITLRQNAGAAGDDAAATSKTLQAAPDDEEDDDDGIRLF